MRLLSVCTGAGLWDRVLVERGHEVVAGCEIDPVRRHQYRQYVGGRHLCRDIADLPGLVRDERFDGVVGGIPCQSRSRLCGRSARYGDLLEGLLAVLAAVRFRFGLFENVSPLRIPGSQHTWVEAMHYSRPHQSRRRSFTTIGLAGRPRPLYRGTVDSLFAYPVVAGRLYGPRRGSVLMGHPDFARLPYECRELQLSLAQGVPRGVAEAWCDVIEAEYDEKETRT